MDFLRFSLRVVHPVDADLIPVCFIISHRYGRVIIRMRLRDVLFNMVPLYVIRYPQCPATFQYAQITKMAELLIFPPERISLLLAQRDMSLIREA